MGTPAFMSPEQASGGFGRLGPATDVYGLGASLYTLLTGKPSSKPQGAIQVLRRVVESDPIPTRRINPAVPRDLDAVVIKAMAREPRCRHATAQELADELRRFLECRPLLYGPPGRMRRAIMTMSRRPRLTLFAVTASILMVAMIYLMTGQVHLAPRKPASDPGQMDITPFLESIKDRSQGILTKAELTSQLEDMTRLRRAIAASAELSCLRRLKEVRQSLSDRPDDPSVHLALAREFLNLGHIYGIASRPREAIAVYEPALVLLRKLCEQNPAQAIYRTELAEAYRVLAVTYQASGRLDEALKADHVAESLASPRHAPGRVTSKVPGRVTSKVE